MYQWLLQSSNSQSKGEEESRVLNPIRKTSRLEVSSNHEFFYYNEIYINTFLPSNRLSRRDCRKMAHYYALDLKGKL